MPKFLRNRADGYVIAFNEHAATNIDFEVVEADEAPQAPEFLSPSDIEAAELRQKVADDAAKKAATK